jgi:4-carboxymuconolactone decarboxylase
LAISDAARRNHDELFPGRVSTLAQTDPELIAHFDNFAFDEVLRDSGLDTRTRLMVQLASMIACQAVSEYRVMLGAALTVGVTPVEVKEIVYQAVPYVGMAKVFDFLHATNDVLTDRGVELPLPGQSTTPQTRLEKGLAVQKEIVGANRVDARYASAPDDEQHIQRYLSASCFGDHLTRTGIDVPTRELLTFAMLVSLGGCEPRDIVSQHPLMPPSVRGRDARDDCRRLLPGYDRWVLGPGTADAHVVPPARRRLVSCQQAAFGQAHHSRRQEGPMSRSRTRSEPPGTDENVIDSPVQGLRRARYGGYERGCRRSLVGRLAHADDRGHGHDPTSRHVHRSRR